MTLITQWIYYCSFALLGLAVIFAIIRLLMGPDALNRMIGLDVLINVSMGILIAYMVSAKRTDYLDLVIIIALIVFVGTISIAHYLEQDHQD